MKLAEYPCFATGNNKSMIHIRILSHTIKQSISAITNKIRWEKRLNG